MDTPAAQRALNIAHAHFRSSLETNIISEIRTSLALATKQLEIAHKADPNATITSEEGELSQPRLRSRVIQMEALSWLDENPARAIFIAEKAIQADPTDAQAFYSVGKFNYQQRNKSAAVQAFKKACELDPDNIEYAKYLDLADNLSKAEIASYKATHVADQGVVAVAATFRVMKWVWTFIILAIGFGISYSIADGISSANGKDVSIGHVLFVFVFVAGAWLAFKDYVRKLFGF